MLCCHSCIHFVCNTGIKARQRRLVQRYCWTPERRELLQRAKIQAEKLTVTGDGPSADGLWREWEQNYSERTYLFARHHQRSVLSRFMAASPGAINLQLIRFPLSFSRSLPTVKNMARFKSKKWRVGLGLRLYCVCTDRSTIHLREFFYTKFFSSYVHKFILIVLVHSPPQFECSEGVRRGDARSGAKLIGARKLV